MPPLIGTASDTEGFWGPTTATLDWCEENYIVTKYLAEFWNTISNWLFMAPPFIGAWLAWENKLERRYTLSFISLCVVGIGSICFHATLLYEMQLLDELPMIYCSCLLIFCIFECSRQPKQHNLTLILILMVVCAMVTLVYLTIVNPLIFQWAYGLLTSVLILETVKAFRKYKGSWQLLSISLVSYATGFILWNVDNNFCSKVREVRSAMPPPVRPFMQLHAVWHTLAGIGSYYHVLYSIDLRLRCLGITPNLKLFRAWLPFVFPAKNTPSDTFQSLTHKASIFILLCGIIFKLLR